MRPAVYAGVGAVRRRQVRLERLDGRPRGRRALAYARATVSVAHECLLATHTAPAQRPNVPYHLIYPSDAASTLILTSLSRGRAIYTIKS